MCLKPDVHKDSLHWGNGSGIRGGELQRLWFLAHFVVGIFVAKMSLKYIHPDRVGNLDAQSLLAYHYLHIFYAVHAITAILLFALLRKTQGPLNAVLAIVAILWTGLMFSVTELAGTTL